MRGWSQFSRQLWFFISLGVSVRDFKQLCLGHLDVHSSWAQICITLYVFYVANSSGIVIEVNFRWKCDFLFSSLSSVKISNNLFWVISIIIWAENRTKLNFTYQFKSTCGTHTLCVSGGAQHSPASSHYSWAQICINLYLFYVAGSSRIVVEVNFPWKSDFSFSLVSHVEISNNFFWVILMFS